MSSYAQAFPYATFDVTQLNTKQVIDPLDMEEDDISMSDSPAEHDDQEMQQASLQVYLDSVPYECESLEEMEQRLEEIVSKIYICAKAKNWLVLCTWDGMLQWYVIGLRYMLPASNTILFLVGY